MYVIVYFLVIFLSEKLAFCTTHKFEENQSLCISVCMYARRFSGIRKCNETKGFLEYVICFGSVGLKFCLQ